MIDVSVGVGNRVFSVAKKSLTSYGYDYLSKDTIKLYYSPFSSESRTDCYDIWLDGDYLVGEVIHDPLKNTFTYKKYILHITFKSSEEWNKHSTKKNNITKLIDKL